MNNLFKSIIFLLFLYPGLSEAGRCYAQENTLTLNLKNVTIKEAFAEIERHSKYVFIFNDRDVDLSRKVTLNVTNRKIDNVLQELFKASDNVYQISGRQITVQKKPAETKPPKQSGTVSGLVIDENGEPVIGASVAVKGTTRGTSTDVDGTFAIQALATDHLEFSYLGYQPQTLTVGQQSQVTVRLAPAAASELEEVTVVAFAKQKKNSVVASISTINTKELKVPSSNLTTAFAGRIAGLISYQRTGEPGEDNAEFFIRGVTTFGTGKANPLILIDGVEMTTDDLARLTTDDIASFSIMKDANATALYGARGANGVILVTTKEGKEGKIKIQFRAEGSHSAPTRNMEFASPVTYMKLHNDAIRTRDPMATVLYSSEKILNTEKGIDPLHNPAIDWQDMLFDKSTFNQRYNLNLSGGGPIARYYIAGSYSRDNGIIKMDKRNNFNNNIQIDRYVLRSNINVNLTKTTEAIVRLHGAFDDYSGPLDDGKALYQKAMNANPVLFQPYYEPDYANRGSRYILFGSYGQPDVLNPYAEMVKGFKTKGRSDMLAQFELKQNLDFITEGLSTRAMFNVNRYSLLTTVQSYKPFFYELAPPGEDDSYVLIPLNQSSGRGTLDIDKDASGKDNTGSMYFEYALQYGRTFSKKHDISGLLVYTLRDSRDGKTDDLQSSLPYRNLGLAGRFTYGYDNRYFFETNFGYNGSERFAKNERFGFFPSAGGGWIVSNEAFMQSMERIISKLKLKATYGLVGNDAIGDSKDRFYYMANVNMNNSDRGYTFGYDRGNPLNGVSISRYADPNITWEISKKTNFGLELNLYNSLELQVDLFTEKRSKILQKRADIPTTMGLQATPSSNIGRASGKGMDISLDYSKNFAGGFWTVFRGNFTYATSVYDFYEEPDFDDVPWRRHTGQKIKQEWGLIAERLFLDEEEVANSPRQFGLYGAGDIKYKDINGDMVIDDNDKVPIGYPTTPEIIYGFGISMGYKNFDFSCFFQGSARSAFWIDAKATAPFINRDGSNAADASLRPYTTNRALLQYWADSHWSETDRDIYALWPRLSTYVVENNLEKSTWFMRDGSFLRLKTAEIGYTLPHRWINKAKMQNARIYLSGSNLAVWSVFKMWDPEMAGNGLAYPLQRVLNIGVNIDF
ncbi:MAG: TonB-dependent receptor [Dysgonamonadaceae bacterium]|jgi:TonB-linked SusC/RagA family outer membrane protein|nr:TonB-dependent receptor [Dysgonamonadaceae bacterium]